MALSESEILVVPAFGQGHLLPSMELCKHLTSRHFRATLVISSTLSDSIPASFRSLPLVQVLEVPSNASSPGSGTASSGDHMRHSRDYMVHGIESLLSSRTAAPDSTRPISCAIIDVIVMMSLTADVFHKYRVPTVGFFTSGACSAAMEFAHWKVGVEGLSPRESRLLPGLPDEMALTESDLKQSSHGPPRPPGGGGPLGAGVGGGPGPKFKGPPKPGMRPPWIDDVAGSIGMLFNTSDDLEHPFIEYLKGHIGKLVWGVGPLLPDQYWKSAGSLLLDRDIRTNRKSKVTEDEVIQWLDSKPCGSVLYVSFGSELGPTMEEYPQLATALEESTSPFIWVLQPGAGRSGPPRALFGGKSGSDTENEGYFPHGLSEKAGDRALIIHGWAPQLLILSHPSTGGFLSHCGWNSTVEAIGRGVPFLTWPIRGDQYHNSKLVVSHLRIGHAITDDRSQPMKKELIVKGIERLMGDKDVKERAALLQKRFEGGFPGSSTFSLDSFAKFIHHKAT